MARLDRNPARSGLRHWGLPHHFYEFRLDDMIPKGHLLRRINVFVTSVLGDLHEQLGPFYSAIGRPSIDPELLIRMLARLALPRVTSLPRTMIRPLVKPTSSRICDISSHRYVMRITGSDAEGQEQLDNFIDPESNYPVLVTTSRLLSTGVDVQTCRLIVLDRAVKPPKTVFCKGERQPPERVHELPAPRRDPYQHLDRRPLVLFERSLLQIHPRVSR